DPIGANEAAADHKCLREAVRTWLHLIRDRQPELAAVPEQPPEAFLLVRRRDDEDGPNPAEHQRRQRVVHHRLAVDGHELFADGPRQRVEARAGATGEDDPLQHWKAAETRSLETTKTRRHEDENIGLRNTLIGGPAARDRIRPARRRTSRG